MNSNQVIEGITVVVTVKGDIKITIHKDDLIESLANRTTLINGTIIAIARKRLSLSSKGHTHKKPDVLQACKNQKTLHT